jgi:hypothetical protein
MFNMTVQTNGPRGQEHTSQEAKFSTLHEAQTAMLQDAAVSLAFGFKVHTLTRYTLRVNNAGGEAKFWRINRG